MAAGLADSPGGGSFTTFSAVCWLYGKRIHQELNIPIGLIASAVGGTPLQSWAPAAALDACSSKGKSDGGPLGNTMIHPFGVGPMRLRSFIWYQAEANAENPVSQARLHPQYGKSAH